MNLSVDATLALPVYEQIREQIVRMIVSGTLAVGTRLPTIRQLAIDLALAKGTVERAYELLESASAIETRGRHGTFVTAMRPSNATERQAQLAAAAETAVIVARQLGADERQLIDAIERAWCRL